MKSNTIKQIIICIFIIAIVGVGAFYIKDYLAPTYDNESDYGKDAYAYNEFQITNVTTEVLIQRYFQDFKYKVINSPKEAYDLLSNNSKNNFSDYSSFLDFVNKKMDKIVDVSVKQYTVQGNSKNPTYIVIDQYGNQYTFSCRAVLIYEIDIKYSSNF